MCGFLCGHTFSTLWLNTKELDCWILWKEYVILVRNHQIVSSVTVPFCISGVNESFCCSTSLPFFGVVSVWILAILIGVVSHCLNLQFSNGIWCWTSFHLLICHLCIFFGEVSVQTLCPFFLTGCLFSYCWILRIACVFWIIVLYQVYLRQIFSVSLLWSLFPSFY